MIADIFVIVDLDRFQSRVVLHQADVGNGKIELVSECFNILWRKDERKAAVSAGPAFLSPAVGVLIDGLHEDVVRQDLMTDQVKSVDPGGADNVENVSVTLHCVNVPVISGRRVKSLPDRIVIEQLGKGILRDDGNTGGSDIMRGDPEIPFVVDHQVRQLALVVQIAGQGRDRLT